MRGGKANEFPCRYLPGQRIGVFLKVAVPGKSIVRFSQTCSTLHQKCLLEPISSIGKQVVELLYTFWVVVRSSLRDRFSLVFSFPVSSRCTPRCFSVHR